MEDLASVAAHMGYTSDDIKQMLMDGFSYDEIEEMIYDDLGCCLYGR